MLLHSSTLKLSFEQPPVRWRPVARFRYGAATARLGYRPQRGLNPLVPSAAVVTSSGMWIADPAKHRIAHYNASGHYIGQALGLSEVASDMALAPDGRLVVIDNGSAGTIRALSPGKSHLSPPIQEIVGHGPGADVLYRLIATPSSLGIWADRQHPLAPNLMMVRHEVGVPYDGSRLTIRQAAGSLGYPPHVDLELSRQWQDEIDFRAPSTRGLQIDLASVVPTKHHVYLWVLADARAGSRTVGGSFLVDVTDGTEAKGQHVQTSAGSASINNSRNLLLGPGGQLYQWFTGRHFAELRRR